jgi:ribosomal protein L16/L10AE
MKKIQKKKLNIYKIKKNFKSYQTWVTMSPAIVTKWQINAIKIFLKFFKDTGGYKKKIQFFKFSTKKAKGSRMGKGAGAFLDEQYYVHSNTTLYTLFSNLIFIAKQQTLQLLLRLSTPNFVRTFLLIDLKDET